MRSSGWAAIALVAFAALGSFSAACGGNVSLGDLVAGTADGSSVGAGADASTSPAPAIECASKAACGPMLGTATTKCADGSLGGPTGRCIETADKKSCVWESRTCPIPPGCFAPSGSLDDFYRKCNTNADCTTVESQYNCCGLMHVTGVASGAKPAVDVCITDRNATLSKCACPVQAGGRVADDGTINNSTPTPTVPRVGCNTTTHTCETSYTGMPCGSVVCGTNQVCCEELPYIWPACVDATSGCQKK